LAVEAAQIAALFDAEDLIRRPSRRRPSITLRALRTILVLNLRTPAVGGGHDHQMHQILAGAHEKRRRRWIASQRPASEAMTAAIFSA
jgi:hypothetical protein